MIATIIFNIFAVILAILASYSKDPKRNLFFSFLIVFIFLALRYDFGNDYMSYLDFFSRVQRINVKDLLRFQEYQSLNLKEFGYTWLNKIFPSFYLLVAFLSLFSCYVYYNVIKSYVTTNFIWFSVFIFLFDPNLMLVQSSAIRQTVAICLFFISIRYLIERNFWKYCILILLGSLFHKSVLVLLPSYFLITPLKWKKLVLILIFGIYLIILFLGYIFLPNIKYISMQYFPQYYETYMENIVGNPIDSGIGVFVISIIFIFIIWAHNKSESYDNIIITKLSIISFVLSPFSIYLIAFGRIQMYFSPFILLSLPYSISLLKSLHLRNILVSILIFWYLLIFFRFFQNPIWEERFSNYKINLIHGF